MSEEFDVDGRLKNIKDNFESQIKDLEVRKDNLEGIVKTLTLRLEQEKRQANKESDRHFKDRENELVKLKNDIAEKEYALELKQVRLKDREQVLERSELCISEFEAERKEFIKEKQNFQMYKQQEMEKVNKAKIEAANLEQLVKDYADRDNEIRVRQKALLRREELLDKQYGVLDQKIREFEIYRSSLVPDDSPETTGDPETPETTGDPEVPSEPPEKVEETVNA